MIRTFSFSAAPDGEATARTLINTPTNNNDALKPDMRETPEEEGFAQKLEFAIKR
jgi:hypothetical protein